MKDIGTILNNAVSDCMRAAGRPVRPRFCFPVDCETTGRLLAQSYRIEVEARRMAYEPGPATDAEIRGVAKWLTSPDLKNSLLLYGRPGTGKTTMALAIQRTARNLKSAFGPEGIDRQQRAEGAFFDLATRRKYEALEARVIVPTYCTAMDLANLAREDRERYTRIVGAGFLIIDDIGPEPKRVNSYGTEYLPIVEAIQVRYDTMRPTIITTNLGDQELIGTATVPGYGLRVLDRLNEMCEKIAYGGTSFRK